MLISLAWRNLWRQPHRTALSLASICFAGAIMVFLLALQEGTYGTMEESVLRLVDGFAQLQPAGYAQDPDLSRTVQEPRALTAQLDALPGVIWAAPRASTYVILSSGPRSYGAALLGVDPAAEAKVSTLPVTISAGRYLRAGDQDDAVLGAALARNLQQGVGSRVTLLGAARDGSVAADILHVVGIFTTGVPELDRQLIEIPLARFQSDFSMQGEASVVAVGARTLAAVGRKLPALRAIAHRRGLVVRDWTALEPGMRDAIVLDASFSLLLYASLLLIIVFITFNTLLMSVLERTRELGVLLAVGMRPAEIARMIWLELLMLAGTGAGLAIALGSALAGWGASTGIRVAGAQALLGQWHMPSVLYPRLDATSALSGPLVIAAALILAGAIPYARVMRLTPLSAMRAV